MVHKGILDFPVEAGSVLLHVRAAITAVIEAIPGAAPIKRPIDLQRALGIRPTLAWRIYKLSTSADPFADGPSIPGPSALKRFFKAAADRGVPFPVLESAASTVDQLQQFVEAHAGDRSSFGSMISGLNQNGSGRLDLHHKRAAFKAQSHIWGVQARTQVGCGIIHPSATEPSRGDGIALRGFIDLKRFRPDARVILSRSYASDNDGRVRHEIQREPIDPDGLTAHGIPLLTRFSTQPAPRFESYPGADGEVTLAMEGDSIGIRSRVTCLAGELMRGALARFREEHNTCEDVTTFVRVPCEVLQYDLLVHEDMYGGPLVPTVDVFSNVGGEPRGLRQECDRLPLNEKVMYAGRGLSALATTDAPRYAEMVEYALRRVGWDGTRFLVYRTRIEFPVMPTSVVVRFDLPKAPASARG